MNPGAFLFSAIEKALRIPISFTVTPGTVAIAGTNFMHESFDKDAPKKFTRSWFAWANTLFGEWMLEVAENRPQVLKQS